MVYLLCMLKKIIMYLINYRKISFSYGLCLVCKLEFINYENGKIFQSLFKCSTLSCQLIKKELIFGARGLAHIFNFAAQSCKFLWQMVGVLMINGTRCIRLSLTYDTHSKRVASFLVAFLFFKVGILYRMGVNQKRY